MGAPPREEAFSPAPLDKSHPKTSPRSKVSLIPWDPDSPAHQERLRLQRIGCGWKFDLVWIEKWARLQREGVIALQWIIFTDDDTQKDEKLARHTAAFPLEAEHLVDSATAFGGKARTPTSISFIPVGHISLDSQYEEPYKVADHDLPKDIYWIATFYVSQALQQFGLGRAAMDSVEEMATKEPLNATMLGLSTARSVDEGNQARWAAMGRDPPKLSVQDWYARRGFVAYQPADKMWKETDPSGKVWYVNGIFMKKQIK